MLAAAALGLDHALYALAYVTGAAAPAVVVAASARLGLLPLYRRTHRTWVSHRLHRRHRASGRDAITIPPVMLDTMRERAEHADAVRNLVLNGSESVITGR